MENQYTPHQNEKHHQDSHHDQLYPYQKPHSHQTGYGISPFVADMEKITEHNSKFKTVLWNGKHLQCNLMSVAKEIGLEIHADSDQFLYIEEGMGYTVMGKDRNNLTYHAKLNKNSAVFIPAGTWHNIVNTGNRPLKLFSIYSPPHHGDFHDSGVINY